MGVMVLVEMQVKLEAVNEAKGLLKQMLPDTRAYDGCQKLDNLWQRGRYGQSGVL